MSKISSFFWLVVSAFVFMTYVFVLFQVVVDLFRDRDLATAYKFLWVVGLVFVPLVTALAYVLFRGKGMTERQREAAKRALEGDTPAEQIAKAKALLDQGVISPDEFARLKSKALA